MDLPGGISRKELDAIRRLERELSSDGYRVDRVALAAGGHPAAIVYAGGKQEPIRRILIAARSILRLVGDVPTEVKVTAEECETLAALRVTTARLAKNAIVEQGKRSAGDVARIDLACHVDRSMDWEGE